MVPGRAGPSGFGMASDLPPRDNLVKLDPARLPWGDSGLRKRLQAGGGCSGVRGYRAPCAVPARGVVPRASSSARSERDMPVHFFPRPNGAVEPSTPPLTGGLSFLPHQL